jgi:hypothetical protein
MALPLEGSRRRGPECQDCQDDVGFQANQLQRERAHPIGVTAGPAKVDPYVAAIGPTQVRKRSRERRVPSLQDGIVFVERREEADAPYPLALLRPRRQRPSRRAAKPPK